jgi:hypothetical protein
MRPALLLVTLCVAGCGKRAPAAPPVSHEDDPEEQEDEDDQRDIYWRAKIEIVGGGTVATANGKFDCTSDGTSQRGTCGPTLVRFKELAPPLLQARDAQGWRFDHWESTLRDRMPQGRMYMNAFGYADTGQLETVTAVFVATK